MEIDQIEMYEILETKLGEKETKAFVHLIEEKMNARKHELATKEDIALLKDDITALRVSTKEDMMKLKDELLRTYFVTSLGQLLAIVACVISLIFIYVKK